MKCDVPTEMTEFPCPICGKYFKPYMTRKDGKALCECPEHGLYQTSIAVSKQFRMFCSKIASKPNRSQSYYTSLEKKVKQILDKLGYRAGVDYIHNCLIPNGRHKYYVDFYLPMLRLVIECNGSVWHNLWARRDSDKRKREFLESLNLKYIEIDEKTYKTIEDILKQLKVEYGKGS